MFLPSNLGGVSFLHTSREGSVITPYDFSILIKSQYEKKKKKKKKKKQKNKKKQTKKILIDIYNEVNKQLYLSCKIYYKSKP